MKSFFALFLSLLLLGVYVRGEQEESVVATNLRGSGISRSLSSGKSVAERARPGGGNGRASNRMKASFASLSKSDVVSDMTDAGTVQSSASSPSIPDVSIISSTVNKARMSLTQRREHKKAQLAAASSKAQASAATPTAADAGGSLEEWNRFKSYGNAAKKPPQYGKNSDSHQKFPINDYLTPNQERMMNYRTGADRSEAMVSKKWTGRNRGSSATADA